MHHLFLISRFTMFMNIFRLHFTIFLYNEKDQISNWPLNMAFKVPIHVSYDCGFLSLYFHNYYSKIVFLYIYFDVNNFLGSPLPIYGHNIFGNVKLCCKDNLWLCVLHLERYSYAHHVINKRVNRGKKLAEGVSEEEKKKIM